MSYIEIIMGGIDHLATRTFEDGKIDTDLNEYTSFFLFNLDQFEGLLTPRNIFKPLYVNHGYNAAGIRNIGIRGLRLAKIDYNSEGNNLKPEFVESLKQSVIAYMQILATAEWKKCTEEKLRTSVLEFLGMPNDPEMICLENKFKKMGAVHCVLETIKNTTRNIDIRILGTTEAVYLVGREENLADFRQVLDQEIMIIKKRWKFTKNARNTVSSQNLT